MDSTIWTRRKLLQAAAVSAVAVSANPLARAVEGLQPERATESDRASVWYVASESQAFQVFTAADGDWQPMQRLQSKEPSAFALSPGGDRLFVANAIDRFKGLPTGSIETYRVDSRSGRLQFMQVQGLALAVKRPAQVAVSPAGVTLAVATADGIVSLHGMREDGSLGEAIAVRKDLQMAATGVAPRLRFLSEDHLCASCDAQADAHFRLSSSGLSLMRRTPPHAQRGEAPLESAILRHLDHPEPRAVLRHRLG